MKVIRWLFSLVAKIASIFHRPVTEVTEAQYLDLKPKQKDFTLLLSKCEGSITNAGIEGTYKHLALFYNGMVYEAVTTGVRKIGFEEWFFKKDHVGAKYPAFIVNGTSEVIAWLEAQIGTPYNWEMDLSDDTTNYCSGYIFKLFRKSNPIMMSKFKTKSDLVVYPDDFWSNDTLFMKVFES